MIYILCGGDEFSLHEKLSHMKEEVGPTELQDVNITVIEGRQANLDQLIATCDTVPFLSHKRMVIVNDLLSMYNPRPPSRPQSQERSGLKASQEKWKALSEYLPKMTETTELIFVEGVLNRSNPLFAKIRELAQILTFPVPAGNQLRQWINQRAQKWSADVDPQAIDSLAEAMGNNLRGIDLELQKLALYRWEQKIRQQDVEELVPNMKEANIFAAVDAVVEGRSKDALPLIHKILDSGRAPSQLISMIARQVRLILIAKELKAQGISSAQIGHQLSLSGFPLRKTLNQEGRLTWQRLIQIHRNLLETDQSIKTGQIDDQIALDMLIAELTTTPTSNSN